MLLGFGAFAVFNGLDKAFTELYGVERGANFPNQVRDAAVVLGVFGTVTILIAATWQVALLPSSLSVGGVFEPVALVVGLSLVLYPMFYVFPEVSLGWREVLPGVVVTAVGWTVLQALFRLYVTFVARSDAFGVVSSALLLATWLYLSGFVLLLGATINAVLHGYADGGSEDDASSPAEAADAATGGKLTDRD